MIVTREAPSQRMISTAQAVGPFTVGIYGPRSGLIVDVEHLDGGWTRYRLALAIEGNRDPAHRPVEILVDPAGRMQPAEDHRRDHAQAS